MAQGFFTAAQSIALPPAVSRALGGVLRFSTGRRLHHKLFENAVDAETWSGFTHDQYGCDTMRIAWTPNPDPNYLGLLSIVQSAPQCNKHNE